MRSLLFRAALVLAVTSVVVAGGSDSLGEVQSGSSAAGGTGACRQFYVATHFNRGKQQSGWDVDRLVPKLKELGVIGIRDECTWAATEKTKGVYAIGDTQRHWLDVMRDNGFKVNLLLSYNNKVYENNLDPDGFANYAAFLAREMKAHYPNVVSFEIWNEPGNFFFRKQYGGEWNAKGKAPWLEKFAELVAKTSTAVKKENPDLLVMAGAAVPPANHYLITRYPEAFKNVDATTEHPYTYRLPPEVTPWGGAKVLERDGISCAGDDHSMKSLFASYAELTKSKLGRELPLYITEFGFGTFTRQNKPSLYDGYTEEAQGAYHTRALIQGLGLGAAAWTIYDLVEDGTNDADEEHKFGILRYDTLEPKPAFLSVSRAAKLLGPDWQNAPADTGSLVVENKAVSQDKAKDEWANPIPDSYSLAGPQVYWFKVPEGMVAFVWNAGRLNAELKPLKASLVLKSREASSAELINLATGAKESLKLSPRETGLATSASVPVGSSPVAVKFSFK